ncbi:MAG: alpha/beta hydrolase [Ktedonobacterales bacterium]
MASDFIPRDAKTTIERVTFRSTETEELVTALLVRPASLNGTGNGARPMIHPAALIQHGYGAEKADLLPLASLLAEHGFISLLPDAWGHGERFPASGPNWMNQLSADYFITVVRHTVADMREALTVLQAQPGVRAGATLVGGFSMGAMAALIVGSEDQRVAGVVSASGSPLPDLVNVSLFGSQPPSEESANWARAHDAAAQVGRLAPKPLLLQHGRQDDMCPIAGTQRMYEAAMPYYAAHPDRLKLMLYDHSHLVTEAQLLDAVNWLAPFFTQTADGADRDTERPPHGAKGTISSAALSS